ncbi:hypothetical protein PVAND_010973 [Polypedilum vanderplanki]|uniref:Uncharacterized protein n=1 Tax=Polypedilum vanderplanki TaxID=319348 RepID=A0A9J6CH78_POLVA|nr:hypothetical protein PVAND_010973 [Polypedilum vanderplanki]
MHCLILALFLSIQLFTNGCNCTDVNNIVKGKILFSNQDLIEKNDEIVHGKSSRVTILSRQGIFEFLKQNLPTENDMEKIAQLLEYLGPDELRHIDFLIYLIGQYQNVEPHLMKAIMEILVEDEKAFEDFMKNFG